MAEPKICRNCIHKNVCETCQTLGIKDAIMIFDFECEHFLPADVVEVVRCKDCIHAQNMPLGLCYLHTEPYDNAKGYKGDAVCVEPDDFCSYGQKKGE